MAVQGERSDQFVFALHRDTQNRSDTPKFDGCNSLRHALVVWAPFLALAMGYGIECIRMNEVGRLLLVPALAYSFLFLLLALWSQMALFAGCAIKNGIVPLDVEIGEAALPALSR